MKTRLALTLFSTFLLIQFGEVCPINAQVVRISQSQVMPAARIQEAAKVSAGVTQAAATGTNPAATATPTAATQTKTPEQKKVELLLKAKFDRTTPAVLKAWSEKPAETQPKIKKDLSKIAAVENSYKGFIVLNFEQTPQFKVGDVIVVSIKDGDENIDVGQAKLLTVDGKTVSVRFIPPAPAKKTSKQEKNGEADKEIAKPAGNPTAEPDTSVKKTDAENSATDNKTESNPTESNPTESNPAESKPAESNPTESKSGGKAKPGKQTQAETPATDSAADNTAGPAKTEAEQEAETEPRYFQLKNGDKVSVVDAKSVDKKEDANKKIQAEVDSFVRDVTLGNWTKVKQFLATLKPDEADKVYGHVLKSLATAPAPAAGAPRQASRGQQPIKPHLSPNDILQLADASPKDIRIEEPKKEKEDDKKTAANPTSQLPPGVQLPPGITIDQLPPATLKAMQAQAVGAPIGATATAAAVNNPAGTKTNHLPALATLISNARTAGHDFSEFYEKVKTGTRHFGGEDPVKRLTVADLFMKAGLTDYVETFLPELEKEETNSNLAALKIWSQLALRKHAEKKVAEWLEKAWKINQNIILIEEIGKTDREAALSNLIELSSQVEKEVGVAWMNASFTDEPERGMTILTNLGSKSADLATKAAQTAESTRLKLLRLQNEAVEKLIELSPEKAESWKQALTLLAQNWLTESATSLQYSQQNSRSDYMSIDMYGNYYWVNQNERRRMMGGNNRQPRPIKLGDILEVAPLTNGKTWSIPAYKRIFEKRKLICICGSMRKTRRFHSLKKLQPVTPISHASWFMSF